MPANTKNLTYESNEPAFLRRLRGEFGGTDSASHRRPQARPRKQRNSDEDDNEPVYVRDGDPHEPISKADYDALLKAPTTEQQPIRTSQSGPGAQVANVIDSAIQTPSDVDVQQAQPATEKTAAIGGSSKKRSARIVGDDVSSDEVQGPKTDLQTPNKHGMKKGKKVKLSFEDERVTLSCYTASVGLYAELLNHILEYYELSCQMAPIQERTCILRNKI
ncbi:MAG: hypothetical protein L6R40_003400 [Gallowayella cf. fulva]|nr:MAG: hypothetical protein L6R40_003400 [Xanthomendoza cf. fulva]